jgi:uncharacterized protein
MKTKNDFPEGMQPLGQKEKFTFNCHPDIDCYMVCCKKVDMFLFPYDVIRLKTYLNITTQEFMEHYSKVVQGQSHPYFPAVMLRLTEDEDKTCPFLTKDGCGVYADRPSACRTYPLERGVDRSPEKGMRKEFYCMTNNDYCHGHQENKEFTIKEWTRDQRLNEYNMMNDLWTEIDTVFSSNPWAGEGSGGPRQQVAFTVCYDIDNFRLMVAKHSILDRFVIPKNQKRRINESDTELLKFGFEWLKNFLGKPCSLSPK